MSEATEGEGTSDEATEIIMDSDPDTSDGDSPVDPGT